MELQKQPVVVKRFAGATEAMATERYAADAVVATRHDYVTTSRTWDGATLTVVYELQARAGAPSQPERVDHVVANAESNQARSEANAQANRDRAEANARATKARAEETFPPGS